MAPGSPQAAEQTIARLAETRTASASSAPARRGGSSAWPRACRTPPPTSTTTCATRIRVAVARWPRHASTPTTRPTTWCSRRGCTRRRSRRSSPTTSRSPTAPTALADEIGQHFAALDRHAAFQVAGGGADRAPRRRPRQPRAAPDEGRRRPPARHDRPGLQQRDGPGLVGRRRRPARCRGPVLTLPVAGFMAKRAFCDDRDRRKRRPRPGAQAPGRRATSTRSASSCTRTPATRSGGSTARSATTSPTRAEQLERTLQQADRGRRAGRASRRRGAEPSRPPRRRRRPCAGRRHADRPRRRDRGRAPRRRRGDRVVTDERRSARRVGPPAARRRRAGARRGRYGRGSPSCASRLDGPLRVAIAGKVKAGKSTLLNALVGEKVAPDRRQRVHAASSRGTATATCTA